MNVDTTKFTAILDAANSKKRVSGFTHDFYNYPARFSPIFVREIINTFSNPGDLILDPFMGGGTTLVESKVLKRNSIGFDISSLAYFVSKVKTTSLSTKEIEGIIDWSFTFIPSLKCTGEYTRPTRWIEEGYLRNFTDKSIWPIRVLMEKYIHAVENLDSPPNVKNFLRAALLKSGQWAIDSKRIIPSTDEFRNKLLENISEMASAICTINESKKIKVICRNKPARKIHLDGTFKKLGSPKLILTSPPYPGVHVMYHRWQIQGRRETPAPFWIANGLDGHGLSHYTMGDRNQEGLRDYFLNIKKSFSSISKICDTNTIIVQVIAFSEPSWQLPKYLETMEAAGFTEFDISDSRMWRVVPNRKWYAHQKGSTNSSNELVLFHKLTN
ncbi:MAG: site-specific DNA-methyltransferase [Cyclobacteriaceae bacterium]|nr:site-specific DNA-methyltransferase [Cyclobacteriaceae bacterium]